LSPGAVSKRFRQLVRVHFRVGAASGFSTSHRDSLADFTDSAYRGGAEAWVIHPTLVPTLFDAAYGNSGQWCIAVKRLYVHESIHRHFVDEFDEARPGNFVPVTVVDNPPDDSRIVREEPFGPVLPILSYLDTDEVVRRANDTHFGLGGSVWGPAEEAADVALRLETGMVWVNEIHVHGIDIPFGGHKQSGMGVENGPRVSPSSPTPRP